METPGGDGVGMLQGPPVALLPKVPVLLQGTLQGAEHFLTAWP